MTWGRVFVAALLIAALVPVAAHARLAAAGLAVDSPLVASESEHFVVWFDPERDWVLAAAALEALEAGQRATAAWFGERTSAKMRVEIAPTIEDFVNVSDRIVVLSPRLFARGYPWRDALNHEYLRQLLVGLSANRAPIWLQEGFARFGAARWRTADPAFLDALDRSLVARALRENALIPFSALDSSLVRPASPVAARLAAAECALAVDYLVTRWQVDGLRRLITALAAAPADQGLDQALLAAIGEPLARFEDGWREMLVKHGFQEVPGMAVPARRFAGGEDADALDPAGWQPLAAQNHLRLGDLLSARGNLRAGLMEYEKARAVAPASAYASLKAARALLALGQASAAAAAAREAVRLAPEYPVANVTLAAALTAFGDREGAVAALRAALELNPFDPVVWRDLGRSLRKLGRPQEAQTASVTALRLVPGNEAFQRSVMQDE